MEKKTKKQLLVELTKEELLEINGGSERKDEKRSDWFDKIMTKFIAAFAT